MDKSALNERDSEQNPSSWASLHEPSDEPETADFLVRQEGDLQRRLKQRHVQMIAIAGCVGTGLFLGSGSALRAAGPLGALLAYLLVCSVVYCTLSSVAEMASWAPISGSFPYYAARWVDPALGFASGWIYYYTYAIATPAEISAAVILLTFWDSNTGHAPIYTAVIIAAVCAVNLFGVRWFGESEVIFAMVKICLIIGLLLVGLVIDLGGGPSGDRIGFRYWKNPGAINRADLVDDVNTDRFLAIVSAIVQAAFSLNGMELVAVAASETESPRRNIRKAVRRVFWRLAVFYILGILMIGMLVAYDDDQLLNTSGTAAQSPFVIAIRRAGIKALPHIVNGAVFSSAFSSANAGVYLSTRILYGLALRGQAPSFLKYCTKQGLPIAAVGASIALSLLAFLNVKNASETVFTWMASLVALGSFFGWISMNVTYLFFYRGMKAQGFDLRANAYNSRLQPFLSIWGLSWAIIFIFINGYAVFFKWNTSSFLIAYINIPIFIVLFVGYKVVKGTKLKHPLEMDFVTGIPSLEETEISEKTPTSVAEKIVAFLL